MGLTSALVGRRLISSTGRRSIENPAVPLSAIDGDHDYYPMLTGGDASSAGMTVNPVTSLTSSAVWRGVSLIAGWIARVPLPLYKDMGDGGREKDKKHPAYKLMRRMANDFTAAFHLKLTLTAHALLTGRGNGYALIRRKGNGDPFELLVLNPAQTYPVRADGVLWYITMVNGKETKLKPHDVIHIKGLGFDGLVGYDVVSLAKESIGGALATRKYGNVYFKNNARPNIVLEVPDELSEKAFNRLTTSWASIHQGIDKSHLAAILEGGTKATVMSDNTKQSLLIEAQQMDIVHIANILGLPPHKVGGEGRTAFASLEQENRAFLDDTLGYWFCVWENELNDKLLTERQKEEESHFFEFVREDVVSVDLLTKVQSIVEEVNNGLLTRNEARRIRNRPTMGPEGDQLVMPMNLGSVELIVDPPPPPEPKPEPPPVVVQAPPIEPDDKETKAAQREILVSVARRMCKRLAVHAKQAASKPDSFVDWATQRMYFANRKTLVDAFRAVFRSISALGFRVGEGTPRTVLLERFEESMLEAAEVSKADLAGSVQVCADRLCATLPEQLADQIMGGETDGS